MNTGIESLEPMNSLYNIGSLKIGANDRLSDIELGNVSKASGDMVVAGNEELADISGLEKLSKVDGDVQIDENGILVSVA